MSYFVKWIPDGRNETFQTGVAYARQSEAIDFACTLLGQAPKDIWIEDGRATRVALQAQIIQHCRQRGSAM